MSDSEAVTKWNRFYQEGDQKGNVALWPNENLVRILKGSYFPWNKKHYDGLKIIDIGFGSGNNLMLCGTMGMDLSGVEIHSEICQLTHDTLEHMGYTSDLKTGSNRDIPFDDNFFDYLISWDAIHYEREPARIKEAIKEFARVLKPGGRMFLSTVAPRHTIFRDSKIVGAHQYLLGRDDDFRKGQVFFCFDAPQYIHYFFETCFRDIQIGRSTLNYFFETNDTFLVTATKS